MDKKIKVMIADDQVILAEGIKSVLETDPELEVIGLAFDGFDALEKMEKNPEFCNKFGIKNTSEYIAEKESKKGIY